MEPVNIPLYGRLGIVAHAIIDSESLLIVGKYRWFRNHCGYAWAHTPRVNGIQGQVLMHRIICNAPTGLEVDHINCMRLDNRRVNLRICTRAQNERHKPPRGNRHLPKGVTCDRGRYRAAIKLDSKRIHLGCFGTVEEARAVRVAAELKYHGEFAYQEAM